MREEKLLAFQDGLSKSVHQQQIPENHCRQHNREILYYCVQCKQYLCHPCKLADDADHTFQYLDDNMEIRIEELKRQLPWLQHKVDQYAIAKQLLKEKKLQTATAKFQIKDKINMSCRNYLNLCEKWKDDTIQHLQTIHEEIDKDLSKQICDANEKTKFCANTLARVKDLLESRKKQEWHQKGEEFVLAVSDIIENLPRFRTSDVELTTGIGIDIDHTQLFGTLQKQTLPLILSKNLSEVLLDDIGNTSCKECTSRIQELQPNAVTDDVSSTLETEDDIPDCTKSFQDGKGKSPTHSLAAETFSRTNSDNGKCHLAQSPIEDDGQHTAGFEGENQNSGNQKSQMVQTPIFSEGNSQKVINQQNQFVQTKPYFPPLYSDTLAKPTRNVSTDETGVQCYKDELNKPTETQLSVVQDDINTVKQNQAALDHTILSLKEKQTEYLSNSENYMAKELAISNVLSETKDAKASIISRIDDIEQECKATRNSITNVRMDQTKIITEMAELVADQNLMLCKMEKEGVKQGMRKTPTGNPVSAREMDRYMQTLSKQIDDFQQRLLDTSRGSSVSTKDMDTYIQTLRTQIDDFQRRMLETSTVSPVSAKEMDKYMQILSKQIDDYQQRIESRSTGTPVSTKEMDKYMQTLHTQIEHIQQRVKDIPTGRSVSTKEMDKYMQTIRKLIDNIQQRVKDIPTGRSVSAKKMDIYMQTLNKQIDNIQQKVQDLPTERSISEKEMDKYIQTLSKQIDDIQMMLQQSTRGYTPEDTKIPSEDIEALIKQLNAAPLRSWPGIDLQEQKITDVKGQNVYKENRIITQEPTKDMAIVTDPNIVQNINMENAGRNTQLADKMNQPVTGAIHNKQNRRMSTSVIADRDSPNSSAPATRTRRHSIGGRPATSGSVAKPPWRAGSYKASQPDCRLSSHIDACTCNVRRQLFTFDPTHKADVNSVTHQNHSQRQKTSSSQQENTREQMTPKTPPIGLHREPQVAPKSPQPADIEQQITQKTQQSAHMEQQITQQAQQEGKIEQQMTTKEHQMSRQVDPSQRRNVPSPKDRLKRFQRLDSTIDEYVIHEWHSQENDMLKRAHSPESLSTNQAQEMVEDKNVHYAKPAAGSVDRRSRQQEVVESPIIPITRADQAPKSIVESLLTKLTDNVSSDDDEVFYSQTGISESPISQTVLAEQIPKDVKRMSCSSGIKAEEEVVQTPEKTNTCQTSSEQDVCVQTTNSSSNPFVSDLMKSFFAAEGANTVSSTLIAQSNPYISDLMKSFFVAHKEQLKNPVPKLPQDVGNNGSTRQQPSPKGTQSRMINRQDQNRGQHSPRNQSPQNRRKSSNVAPRGPRYSTSPVSRSQPQNMRAASPGPKNTGRGASGLGNRTQNDKSSTPESRNSHNRYGVTNTGAMHNKPNRRMSTTETEYNSPNYGIPGSRKNSLGGGTVSNSDSKPPWNAGIYTPSKPGVRLYSTTNSDTFKTRRRTLTSDSTNITDGTPGLPQTDAVKNVQINNVTPDTIDFQFSVSTDICQSNPFISDLMKDFFMANATNTSNNTNANNRCTEHGHQNNRLACTLMSKSITETCKESPIQILTDINDIQTEPASNDTSTGRSEHCCVHGMTNGPASQCRLLPNVIQELLYSPCVSFARGEVMIGKMLGDLDRQARFTETGISVSMTALGCSMDIDISLCHMTCLAVNYGQTHTTVFIQTTHEGTEEIWSLCTLGQRTGPLLYDPKSHDVMRKFIVLRLQNQSSLSSPGTTLSQLYPSSIYRELEGTQALYLYLLCSGW